MAAAPWLLDLAWVLLLSVVLFARLWCLNDVVLFAVAAVAAMGVGSAVAAYSVSRADSDGTR
jgi:hypothetical protein